MNRFRRTLVVALGWVLALAGIAWGQTRRPNIVVILADDLGFSDLGCYGSEIATPNLDRLAKTGLRFTQFYNAARCCPTRASLLTGLYPHQVGIGHMTDDLGQRGYQGNLSARCVTIAEVLGESGYQTLMCGKWHLTSYTQPSEPNFAWPTERGFQKFYGTLEGGGSYFNPVSLMQGGLPTPPLGDYYYTDALARQARSFLDAAPKSGKPFFLYVAFTAPHWPLHARDDDIAAYRGKYAAGWDAVRQSRHRRMIDMGIVRRQWPLTPRDPRVTPWAEVPHKDWHQRRMEVYAAQVDVLDRAVGSILDHVDNLGLRENTLVLFLADNGGCAEEIGTQWKGRHIPTKTRDGRSVQVGNIPGLMPGPETTYQSYGTAWANVSNTPFRQYKHLAHEGGISTPLIVAWPAECPGKGAITHEVGHLTDIMAMCLDAAQVRYPTRFRGRDIALSEGESLLPVLAGRSRRRAPIFWEHEGNRAVRDGKWKLVSKYPGPWELYDMEADRTETQNLAEQRPEIVDRLSIVYDDWMKRVGVVPWNTIWPPK